MRTAVLGMGIMGAGMARSLLREGHDVVVWNRTRTKAEPLAAVGATLAESVSEAVERADAVITVLYDVEATLAVSERSERTNVIGLRRANERSEACP